MTDEIQVPDEVLPTHLATPQQRAAAGRACVEDMRGSALDLAHIAALVWANEDWTGYGHASFATYAVEKWDLPRSSAYKLQGRAKYLVAFGLEAEDEDVSAETSGAELVGRSVTMMDALVPIMDDPEARIEALRAASRDGKPTVEKLRKAVKSVQDKAKPAPTVAKPSNVMVRFGVSSELLQTIERQAEQAGQTVEEWLTEVIRQKLGVATPNKTTDQRSVSTPQYQRPKRLTHPKGSPRNPYTPNPGCPHKNRRNLGYATRCEDCGEVLKR